MTTNKTPRLEIDRLSIEEMKTMLKVYKDLSIKLHDEAETAYRKGYIKGGQYNRTLLIDVDEKDLVL